MKGIDMLSWAGNFNWRIHKALEIAAQVAEELDTIGRDHVGGCSSFLNRVSVARP
ncbi:MAG: hypothetical protein R8G66_14150 [Cytophagales bacterium]|nr:hypothetical protein [Cytophagales bacterium]